MAVLTRYWLLQIPGALLLGTGVYAACSWFDLPLWLVVLAVVLKLSIDAFVYPYVRDSYVEGQPQPRQDLVGQSGIVTIPLQPVGQVLLNGERWRARAEDEEPFAPETEVEIVGVDEGLVLIVKERS